MDQLQKLVAKAQNSPFYLWLLNVLAKRMVPFNKVHDFTIKKISKSSINIEVPYKRANLNHIKGIHACALATLCEYATGVVLLNNLDATQYRIILKNIHVDYHYQAKSAVSTKFELSATDFEKIHSELKTTEAIFSEQKIEAYDSSNNHICTGLINWQIKAWNKVKTKV
jgi:acyl-coenzyme A thioesterase PaaI-like protein